MRLHAGYANANASAGDNLSPITQDFISVGDSLAEGYASLFPYATDASGHDIIPKTLCKNPVS
ncbi:hypothetical protein [Aerosakkonema sp. BLCC-F183]|uniref:hypothetical protein n=1 Tax=Aerosakkonema sp. BLCC-F183 TaxID=3342834 RepID=UPI0035BC424C